MVVFLTEEKKLEELILENKEKKEEKEIIEKTEDYTELINAIDQEINYSGSINYGKEIKNYHYEEIKDVKITPRGDNYEQMLISFETEVLAEGQDIIAKSKEAENSNQIYLEFDMRRKDIKADIALMNPATWKWMYEVSGRFTFN
ncbi:hypothetical protein DRJ22_02250 [Candidatus Woesearchaeota archaeon]|nr:MAG: hypothetical protein B6U93_01065 [Candidatus Woesearchaeota archaeon ex4484_78]RLE46325.1 MAG: hypothetical protein DRJ22_02250 [Candidatus Woesearchaeota archaeon]